MVRSRHEADQAQLVSWLRDPQACVHWLTILGSPSSTGLFLSSLVLDYVLQRPQLVTMSEVFGRRGVGTSVCQPVCHSLVSPWESKPTGRLGSGRWAKFLHVMTAASSLDHGNLFLQSLQPAASNTASSLSIGSFSETVPPTKYLMRKVSVWNALLTNWV